MHFSFSLTTRVLLALVLALPLFTQAAPAEPPKTLQFNSFEKAREMARRLEVQHGIPSQNTLDLLSQAQFLPRVVQAVKPPAAPNVRNWDTYRSRFVENYRIKNGILFWQNNAQSLQAAQQQYGIPAEVIVAIIGIETIYGQHTGNYRVIDSLATLGFAYPKGQRDRSEFFLKELESFLALCNNSQLDALEVKGSYAGAIGLGQFMPSSWAAFAVDGDKDGLIDLFHSTADAIFSVANFLKVHGWETGKAMLVPVEVEFTDNLAQLLAPDIVPTFTAETLEQKGLKLKGKVLPLEKLALIELVRGDNPSSYVVGGQNFYAVTRYNKSSFYATAVLELAQALALNRSLSTDSLN